MNRKNKKKEQSEKQKVNRERSKVTNKLYRECILGGNLQNIKKVISKNEFSISELEEAIRVLEDSVSSSLENNLAEESIVFIRKIINGKKLLRKK